MNKIFPAYIFAFGLALTPLMAQAAGGGNGGPPMGHMHHHHHYYHHHYHRPMMGGMHHHGMGRHGGRIGWVRPNSSEFGSTAAINSF
jgi:hypothetical protein